MLSTKNDIHEKLLWSTFGRKKNKMTYQEFIKKLSFLTDFWRFIHWFQEFHWFSFLRPTRAFYKIKESKDDFSLQRDDKQRAKKIHRKHHNNSPPQAPIILTKTSKYMLAAGAEFFWAKPTTKKHYQNQLDRAYIQGGVNFFSLVTDFVTKQRLPVRTWRPFLQFQNRI